jgi:hypothetical protein
VFFLGKTFRASKVGGSSSMKKEEILEQIRIKEEEINCLLFDLKNGSSTPPLFDQLDRLVEQLMLTSISLREGQLSKGNNPSLIFSERDFPLLKGFPVSFKVRDSRHEIIDETLSELLRNLAESLICFKRHHSLGFLDQELVTEIKRYRSKIEKRLQWSQYETTKFLTLLQEEFPSKKDKGLLIRFLKWINSYFWEKW